MTIRNSRFYSMATGAAALSLVNVFRLLLQTFSLPVMARLLSPEDYGLAAIAMPLVLFAMLMADGGLASSLIRHGNPDSVAWHSCFWMSCCVGACLSGLIALAAPAAGAILGEPKVVPVIATLGIIVLGQAASLVPGAALQQSRNFTKIAMLEVFVLLLALGTAVACAAAGFGVWALVWQQVVLYAARVILTLWLSPYRVRFIFSIGTIREHAAFGGNVIGVGLIALASRTIDNAVIGGVCGAGAVGLFAMALQLSRLPSMLATGPLQYVIYPYITDQEDDRIHVSDLFLLFSRLLAIVILPSVGLIAAASAPIFHLLLSGKWDPAIEIFTILAVGTAVQAITALSGTFLMAMGRTKLLLTLSLIFTPFWSFFMIGSVWWGVVAVAEANAIWTVIFALSSLYVSFPLIGCTPLVYLRTMLLPLVLTALAIGIYYILRRDSGSNDVLDAVLAMSIAVSTIAICFFFQRVDLLRALKAMSHGRSQSSKGPAMHT